MTTPQRPKGVEKGNQEGLTGLPKGTEMLYSQNGNSPSRKKRFGRVTKNRETPLGRQEGGKEGGGTNVVLRTDNRKDWKSYSLGDRISGGGGEKQGRGGVPGTGNSYLIDEEQMTGKNVTRRRREGKGGSHGRARGDFQRDRTGRSNSIHPR